MVAPLGHPGGGGVGLGWRLVTTGLLLDDLRVDGRHAVDLVGAHDRQVPHPDLLDLPLLSRAKKGPAGKPKPPRRARWKGVGPS